MSVNFATLCILTTSYFYRYFECLQYLYYKYTPIMLVLCYFAVYYDVFLKDFKHIQDFVCFVISCQYTVMTTGVPAKAVTPVRGDR